MKDLQIKEQRDGSTPDASINTLNAGEWNVVSQGIKKLVQAAQLPVSPVNAEAHDGTQLTQAVDIIGNLGWRDQSLVPNQVELVPYNSKAEVAEDYALHDGRYFIFKPNRTNTGATYVSLSDIDEPAVGNKPLLNKEFNALEAGVLKQNVDVIMQYLNSVGTGGAFVLTGIVGSDTGNIIKHNELEEIQGGIDDERFHLTEPERDGLRDLLENGSDTGVISWFAMTNPPDGWLVCNGSEISRTTYNNLFTAIGTTFGSGNGSSTFKIPDLRGYFVRGWDNGRGVDSGRSFGSTQTDTYKSHNHSITNAVVPYSTSTYITDFDDGNGMVLWKDNIQTSSSGGSETRPKNIALLPCIKY